MLVKTEGRKEGKVKRREERRIIGEGCGVREEGGVRRRKNCKSAVRRGTVCGGRRWSAVVRCKSPSTAFNYDVIANTDDGYFLRYTLYITRGPPCARTKGRGGSLSVYGLTY